MLKSISLECQENGSDKVYNIAIAGTGDGFNVNFEYGRRGSTLKPGTKNSAPLDIENAEKLFNKLFREKTSKGYVEVGNGDTQSSSTSVVSPEERMEVLLLADSKLSSAEKALQHYINNPEYVGQEKYDGDRRGIRLSEAAVKTFNKKGFPVAVVGSFDELKEFVQSVELDCEQVGETIYVFDILSLNGDDLRKAGFLKRYKQLEKLVLPANFIIAPVAVSKEEKEALVNRLLADKKEGAVFKNAHAPHHSGRYGEDYIRVKFTAEASFFVTKVNATRSVGLGLLDSDGKEVSAGNVTIPVNKEIPPVGSIVEVKYLYAFKSSGIIFQPAYKAIRSDVEKNECTVAQLKFKAE